MRTAVIRVNLDPDGRRAVGDLERTVTALRDRGIEVLAPALEKLPPAAREIELITPGDDPTTLMTWAEAACTEALGAAGPRASRPTFLSRGTDEDALGVVSAFGISADLERLYERDEEVAIFTVSSADAGHVGESRLHTALEAALNCEVRIVVV
jgi:hypothetical protein